MRGGTLLKLNADKRKNGVKLANDMIYTTGATVVMQIVLQLILYPTLNKFFGDNVTGTILYFIGIVYIFPQAVGTALCNTRLISRKTSDTTNGDFSRILSVYCAVCALICFFIGFMHEKDIVFSLFFALFSIVYAVRMYAQVEFRLTLNFKGYFFYYLIISVGYLIGLGLYFVTHIWLLIFFTGELMALAYSLFKGSIFKKQQPTGKFKSIFKNNAMLMFSTLLRDGVNQYDKVVIFMLISAVTVTQYNALSLIGKSTQMLIGPVNTLIVSYLSAKEYKTGRNFFRRFTAISLSGGLILFVFCQIATPIYMRIFYNSFYDEIIQYSLLVNLGLIAGFTASLFCAAIMSQGKTTTYTLIQTVWGVSYIAAAYFLTKSYGIIGLIRVCLVLNVLKLIVSVILTRVSFANTEMAVIPKKEVLPDE
jgi:O-antigen/teichoic acid export membrane protein